MSQESAMWDHPASARRTDPQQVRDEVEDRRTLTRIGFVVVGVIVLTAGLVSLSLSLS